MSFLDSLESNLKSLEDREETAQNTQEERKRREAEQAETLAAAPFAEQLRTSPFTEGLLAAAVRLGHAQRMKVHIAWLGSNLRLEARGQKLELRPGPTGVRAVFLKDNEEVRAEPLDLSSDPATLASEWISTLS